MKYGACTLNETPCSIAAERMRAQVASVTRTDCTQPNSSAVSARDLLNWIAPTEPPGFLGVPVGEPTVPNRKERPTLPPSRVRALSRPWTSRPADSVVFPSRALCQPHLTNQYSLHLQEQRRPQQ